jgi:hypothetical protein
MYIIMSSNFKPNQKRKEPIQRGVSLTINQKSTTPKKTVCNQDCIKKECIIFSTNLTQLYNYHNNNNLNKLNFNTKKESGIQ